MIIRGCLSACLCLCQARDEISQSLSLSSPLSPCFFFVYGWPPCSLMRLECSFSFSSSSSSATLSLSLHDPIIHIDGPNVNRCPCVPLFFLSTVWGVYSLLPLLLLSSSPLFFSSPLLLSNSIQQTWQHQHRLDHLDQPKQTSSYDTLFFLVCCASDR